MKYFLLQLDPSYTNAANVINWYGKLDKRKISTDDAWRLEDRTVFYISSHYDPAIFTDLLTSPFFMVTKKVRKVLHFYDGTIFFKQVVLIEQKHHQSQVYNLPILEKIDCLAEGTVYNLDKSVIKKCVIDPRKTMDKCIFWLGGMLNTYTVIRCDLAESILQRKCKGIGLIPIDTI